MEKKKSVAAIVVTYNRKQLLQECLDALLHQTEKGFDILVIDNASTDGTDELINTYRTDYGVLSFNTGANIGGAGGFNYGIRKAYELGYEYFWLMDDDTIPTETALQELLAARDYLKDDFGFLYSYPQWTDGKICYMNGPDDDPRVQDREELKKHGLTPISRATFVSFFVKRSIVKKVGLPLKEFFIWSDDTEYCHRICKEDKGYWVMQSVVVHKMKTNTEPNNIIDSPDRLGRYFYSYRNRHYLARKEQKLGEYYWLLIKRVGRILISAKDHRPKRIAVMLNGAWHGIWFHPSVEYVEESQE